MATVKDLRTCSHSRESVALTYRHDKLCVEKTSCGDGERFLRNIRKQKAFRPLALSGLPVSAAPILEDVRTADHVGIVMPYIHGLNGADFALLGNRETAHDVARALSALLNDTMARATMEEVPASVFHDKMDQVLDSTTEPALRGALELLRLRLRTCLPSHTSVTIPLSDCHGDLTLSNVILSQSAGLVLVDFLDSFVESPLQDLAKLAQDMEFGWSFRFLDNNLRIKARVFCRLAYPGYARFLHSLFPVQASVLRMLCLARIAPYVKDDTTLRWLDQALHLIANETVAPATLTGSLRY